jgi:hypothetical protein
MSGTPIPPSNRLAPIDQPFAGVDPPPRDRAGLSDWCLRWIEILKQFPSNWPAAARRDVLREARDCVAHLGNGELADRLHSGLPNCALHVGPSPANELFHWLYDGRADRVPYLLAEVNSWCESTSRPVKGKAGRRGYPLEALEYAQELRKKNPAMKAHAIRQLCLQRFSADDLPPDGDSFRAWMNRKRTNRTN